MAWFLLVHLALIRRPKLSIEPSTHIRRSKGESLRLKCFDPYQPHSTTITWFRWVAFDFPGLTSDLLSTRCRSECQGSPELFSISVSAWGRDWRWSMRPSSRKGTTLTRLPNQHSNGILEFSSLSVTDSGQYLCRGKDRRGFTEEIVTLELIGRPRQKRGKRLTISRSIRITTVHRDPSQGGKSLSDGATPLDSTDRMSRSRANIIGGFHLASSWHCRSIWHDSSMNDPTEWF